MHKDSRIIITGAGVFGLSTAVELVRKGYRNITIVDRHVPPVSSLHERKMPKLTEKKRYRMAPASTSRE
jgi:2-polyprenyl-6-methoxyphenol hydroxylase-like FAD-dependent oxidoreductase